MMIRSHGWMFPIWLCVIAIVVGSLVAIFSSRGDKK
jgi:hypothetical protein